MQMRLAFLCALIGALVALPMGPASAHDDDSKRGSYGRYRSGAGSKCDGGSRSCSFVFSRATTVKMAERLSTLVSGYPEQVEKLATQACKRAEKKNECEDIWVAGLLNGVDALEFASDEGSCGTLKLRWSRSLGLSQEWSYTNGSSCRD